MSRKRVFIVFRSCPNDVSFVQTLLHVQVPPWVSRRAEQGARIDVGADVLFFSPGAPHKDGWWWLKHHNQKYHCPPWSKIDILVSMLISHRYCSVYCCCARSRDVVITLNTYNVVMVIYIYIHILIHTYVYIYIHTYVCVYIYIYMYIYIYYICTQIYIYIYTYIHKHIHTQTYTYIQTYIQTDRHACMHA